ncbi:alpha-xenorhabdolysin family binary toxin subunit A [Bacillus sp. JJ864]|uniref:alpha-xenorhabdolysin family binary toxin subunit A n=1 Tax=Bacillus sp. JJ864 TaxID=3122975 RepID=UPI0030008F56
MVKRDISPRDLGGSKESPFLLSKEDWIMIQKYTGDGVYVPVNEAEMRKTLALSSSDEIPDFGELYSVYSNVKSHCQNWTDNTYREVLGVANEIVNYSRRATVYYKPLLDYLPAILDGDTKSLEMFQKICKKLAKEAAEFRDHAGALATMIGVFATDTANDYRDLTEIKVKYDEIYGEHSDEVEELRESIGELREELEDAMDNYEDYKSQSWLSLLLGPIWGLVLKEILDSTEGKVLEAKVKALEEQIEEAEKIIKRNVYLMSLLDKTDSGINKIQQQMADALPIIQKIHGIWNSLHHDLDELSKIVMEDIHDDPEFADLGIELAIMQWEVVGQEADDFRVNADVGFIVEQYTA